jgi:hypothetical protein
VENRGERGARTQRDAQDFNCSGDSTGKGGADDGYGANAVVVLQLLAQLSVDRMFHLALHTVITGTREGAADFNAVNGGHHKTSGPIRAEYSIAFQLTGDLAAQSENSTGILPFEGARWRLH